MTRGNWRLGPGNRAWVFVAIFAMILTFSACGKEDIATAESVVKEEDAGDLKAMTPVAKEETTAGKETVSVRDLTEENGFVKYASEEELKDDLTKHWSDKLCAEGRISDEGEFVLVDAYPRDAEYSYVFFHNHKYRRKLEENIMQAYDAYFMSVSREGDIVYYFTTMDYCESMQEDGKSVIYAGNAKDEVIDSIKELSSAMKVELPFGYRGIQSESRGGSYVTGVNWFSVFEREWSEEKLEKLHDPITAAETLLNLKGGTGTYVPEDEKYVYWESVEGEYRTDAEFGRLEYMFSDGETVTYCMLFDGNYWRPLYCTEKDDLAYPELKGIKKYTDRRKKIVELAVQKVTSEELKEMVVTITGAEREKFEDSYGAFRVIESIPSEDVVLYGAWGGEKTVLRVGEQIYPTDMKWMNWYQEYSLSFADYDGDGELEYACIQGPEYGATGQYSETLYVIDVSNQQVRVSSFSLFDLEEKSDGTSEKIAEELGVTIPEEDYGIGRYEYYKAKANVICFEYCVIRWNGSESEEAGIVEGELKYLNDGSFQFKNVAYIPYESD